MRWKLRAVALGLVAMAATYLYFPTSSLEARAPAPARPAAGPLPWISVSSRGADRWLADDQGRTVLSTTPPPPVVSGACVSAYESRPAAGTLELRLKRGQGCAIGLAAAA